MPLIAMAALAGLLAGSFLNACIFRIPRGMSPGKPRRSFCPHCSRQIAWWQNIPLVSFVLLKGRCGHCRQPISIQYPLVELVSAASTAGLFYLNDFPTALFYLPLLWGGIAIAVIDWHHFIIPDSILLPMIIAAAGLNLWLSVLRWPVALMGALVALGVLFSIRWLAGRLMGREAMGLGDVKFGGVLGFFMGGAHFIGALFLAAIIALILRFFQVGGKKKPREIPFGPALFIGGMISLLYGNLLWQLYLDWLNNVIPF